MDVGNEADADFLGFPQWEIQQERDADYGGLFEEGASLHGMEIRLHKVDIDLTEDLLRSMK